MPNQSEPSWLKPTLLHNHTDTKNLPTHWGKCPFAVHPFVLYLVLIVHGHNAVNSLHRDGGYPRLLS